MAVPFPDIAPGLVRVQRLRAQANAMSPISFRRDVNDWGGRAWMLEIDTQMMDRIDARLVANFLRAVEGSTGTFTLNITPWCPGVDPAPGEVTFRLRRPNVSMRSRGSVTFNGRIVAVQDVLADADVTLDTPFGEGWHGRWYEYETSEEILIGPDTPGWITNEDSTA